jgi:phytoene dehydrogenase-like protein
MAPSDHRQNTAELAMLDLFLRELDRSLKPISERLDRIVPALRNILHATPPSPKGGLMDIINAAQLAFQMNKLDIEGQRDLLDLFSRSAGEWLDEWFESDPIKAVLGFDSIVGNFGSPYTPGSAYVLLHHVFGEVNGVSGAWGHAIGGNATVERGGGRKPGALRWRQRLQSSGHVLEEIRP